jgi:hypothetical protein
MKHNEKTYYTVGTVPKSNKIDIQTNIHCTHDRPFSLLGTGTSINSGKVKSVLLTAEIFPLREMMRSMQVMNMHF